MRTSFLRAAALIPVFFATGCESEPTGPMWAMRPDSTDDPLKLENITLLPGGNIEIKNTANSTLWKPGGEATPPFRLTARVHSTNLGLHPHGAGIAFGGKDVAGDKQTYTYFMVRGDGHFLIKTRDGTETGNVHPWTEHDAVAKEDSDLQVSNVLSVAVGKEQTRFFVNDKEVYKHTNKDLHTTGKFGVRLVHDLNVRFDQIKLTPGAE